METSLHSTSLAVDELEIPETISQETIEEEHHVHLPNPSLWPILLSLAILVAVAGLLFIPNNPWLTVVAVPFVLVGILGWALEDPMGSSVKPEEPTNRYRPIPPAHDVLDQARAVVEQIVTISSTAFSTHPVKVELEDQSSAGVTLTLYGKVELQAQREAIEDAVRRVWGVAEVKNFIVAEDEILQIAYARLENMQAGGKLEGAQNISTLVENSILHLYGDVPNTKMKAALEREMIGIPGVTVVVNHIGLNKEIPGNLGKTRNKVGS